ncbi:MAG: hypothetical protein RR350_09165, partial [Oscillibacter sp.]
GDNLTLTATMTYAHRDIHITGSATGQTNSLFAAREGQNIAVSRVRHLNNLRAALYPAAVSGATITQSQAIDFDFKKWDKADYLTLTNNPLQTFAPIENEKLLTRVTSNGGNNPIVGFPIAGEDNVGLFAAVKSGSLHHMRLVDFAVSGSGNRVGALAGQITDTTVEDCGVYLNTLDDAGRFLPDLPQRLTQYTVKGKTYVGGLVGQALGNTALRDSFAAISVTAVDCAGGLLGGYENKAFMEAVVNCYASGGVAANPTTGRAGGLVGTVSNGGLSNCYSTSDVTAAKAGGLVAVAANALLQDCKVYGRVEAPSAGALVGNGSARYQGSCRFLIQAGYNEALSRPAGVTATDYDALKAVPPNGKENSHPYHSSLAKSAFPFPLLKTLPGMLMPHYG